MDLVTQHLHVVGGLLLRHTERCETEYQQHQRPAKRFFHHINAHQFSPFALHATVGTV
jgi:hypothetical protein